MWAIQGGIKDWGQKVWVTLNANGGEFLLKAAQTATPDNATSSTASKDEGVETSTTLDVGGWVSGQDGNGLYLEFRYAQPAADSAKEGWNPMVEGPEKAPSGDGLEFDGWYTDKTFEDLFTKLTDDSKLYGRGDAYARWVNPNQATVKDEYAETHVTDVKVSGLKEDRKLVFAGMEEDKKKDVEEVTALLAGTEFSSHVLPKDSSALVQLDISVEGSDKVEGPVGITMRDPFKGKYDYVLVLHLTDDGSKVRDNGIQSAVLDKEAATLSFTADGFSPYILAGVDTKMVKIKIENVKNGALVVWSEERNEDGTRTYKVVPIGEEVEIPAGTELLVGGSGVDTGEDYYFLKDGYFQVASGGKTEKFEEGMPYIVSEDAVFSGDFVLDEYEDESYFSITPDYLESPGIYEGAVTGSAKENGTKVPLTVTLIEEDDEEGWRWTPANELFTLEDGVLKSKEELKAGSYTLGLKGVSPEGEVYSGWERIEVSGWRVRVKPDRIPEPGIFKGTVETFVRVNGRWSEEPMSVELNDDYDEGRNDNRRFVLKDNVLTSIEPLEMGVYRLDLRVELPSGDISRNRVTVYVGMGSYFYAPLAQYEYSEGEETYTEYISCTFARVYEKEGALFEDAEKDFHKKVKEVAMYGDHKFKGWVDENGKAIVGSAKLKETNDFVASFENYTPVKVGETLSPDNPDDSVQPGRRPSGGSGGSSSGGGRAASSGGDTISGDWKKDEKGWWLQLKNGDYAKNQWGKINNAWYFFGADGYMLTGWQMINGKWYYLNPVSDGTQGSMAADTYIGEYYVNADGAWVE